MEKIILPINDFPGYYISNYGDVYSKWTGRCKKTRIGNDLKKLKISYYGGRGIISIKHKNGKRMSKRVHRIVLENFIGPCPKGMEACHFPDRDTKNNRLDNLRWDTKSSNYNDRIFHKTDNSCENNGSCKLTKHLVKEIREKRINGTTYNKLSIEYSVSLSNIQQICERKTWKTVE